MEIPYGQKKIQFVSKVHQVQVRTTDDVFLGINSGENQFAERRSHLRIKP